MEFTGMELKGLGLIGEHILCLIDRGVEEPLDLVFDKMVDGTILSYLFEKYPTKTKFEAIYDLNTISKFFSENYPCAESSSSGISGENSGLLLLLSVIMNEVEHRITQWK